MTQTSLPRAMATLFLMCAVIAVVYVVFFTGHNGGYKVTAYFQDADNLATKGQVKIGGVVAGEITKMQVTPQDTVKATIKLDKNAAPIGTGASINIRPVDLLGEHYADLNPGNLHSPLPSGSVIPLSRTSESVELDDVLNMLDVPTREGLRILINEAGVALQGRSADFNQLLTILPNSLSTTKSLINQIGDQTQTVENLIAEGNRVAGSVAGKSDQMGALVSQASNSFGVLAQKRAQIGATLRDAPSALGQLTSTLGQLRSAANQLSPAADALRSTAPSLTAALNVLPSFQSAAQGTLKEARAVAPSLTNLGNGGITPVTQLNPTLSLLRDFQTQLSPSLGMIDQRAAHDLLWFVQNWYLATKNRDSIGHFVGVNYVVPLNQLAHELDAFLGSPSSPGFAARQALLRKQQVASTPATKPKPLLNLPQLSTPSSSSSKHPATSKPSATGGLAPAIQQVSSVAQNTVSTVSKTVGDVTKTVQNLANGLLHPAAKPAASSTSSSGGGSVGSDAARLFQYLFGNGS
jgi:phospholipid/cholesterol/gamma-HCH transport system substrate-binding protein